MSPALAVHEDAGLRLKRDVVEPQVDKLKRFSAILGSANYFHIRLLLNQRMQTLSHNCMVVG